ncbi:MAG: hypothetical protein WKF84_15865, partial [Pyrinomonadaceae bacterium]
MLVTRGMELSSVKSVALDVESRTSAALVTIIFREFLGLAPRLTSASWLIWTPCWKFGTRQQYA